MKRLTVISEQLSKITVLKFASVLRLSQRLAFALMMALAAVAAGYPTSAYAATSSVPDSIPSVGKDFWLTYMQNSGNGTLDLQIIAIPSADGTLTLATLNQETGEEEVRLSQAMNANEPVHYSIPSSWRNIVYNTTSGEVRKSGLHVTSDVDITLYMRNRTFQENNNNSYDYSIVFPTKTLSTDYILQTHYRDEVNSLCAIVATADGTTKVTITPSCQMLKSDDSWYPVSAFDVYLEKGEVFQLKGEGYNKDDYPANMSGTTIGSDKPVAVFNGGAQTWIPRLGGVNGDHIFEQVLPTYVLGKRFVLMDMSAFPDDVAEPEGYPTLFGVTALYDNTIVYVQSAPKDTLVLMRGETTSMRHKTANHSFPDGLSVAWKETPKVVESTKPVSVYGYMLNYRDNMGLYDDEDEVGVGEPSMAIIPDVHKGVHEAFYLCDEAPMNVHYVNVVVPDSGVPNMRLNGDDVSGKFKLLDSTFNDSPIQYAYARLQLVDGQLNKISNAKASFIAIEYSVLKDAAISEAGVATMNMVPTAPVMFIDDNEIVHGDTLDYCNRHPGVHFTAIVDYPHESVKWVLGEGAESEDYEASHMYGATIGEEDKKHDVKLYVYRESPITHIKDTDSICVTLDVHPVYYDTLKTKVAANKMSYVWDSTSFVPFGLYEEDGVTPRYKRFELSKNLDLAGRKPWLRYEKDSTIASFWIDSHAHDTIFDSLQYATRHFCDSIFYLQLEVVPDIIADTVFDTICQSFVTGAKFEWDEHPTGDSDHKMSRENSAHEKTYDADDIYKLDVAGDFIIRDTMVYPIFPYPDSICVLKLHITPKPAIRIVDKQRKDTICEGNVPTWTWKYHAENYDSVTVQLKKPDGTDLGIKNAKRTNTADDEISLTGLDDLDDGDYILIAHVLSDSEWSCKSDTDTVSLRINNRPWMKITRIDSICYPVDAIEVDYIHSAADTIIYSVDSVDGPNKYTDKRAEVDASGKFSINTNGWPHGKYKVTAFPRTKLSCDSSSVTTYFWIYNKPEVYDVHVYDTCYNVGEVRVSFKTKNDAKTYKYSFNGGDTWLDGAADAKAEQTIKIALPAAAYADSVGLHTFKIQAFAEAGGCASDIAEDEDGGYTIKPLPKGQISLTQKLDACDPCDHDLAVDYTTTDAKWIKWQLKNPNDVYYPETPEYVLVSETPILYIPQAKLTVPGGYELRILALKSDFGCEVTDEAHVGTMREFTIYSRATISLAHIDSVCEKQSIRVPATTTFADTIFCIVTKNNVEWLRDTVANLEGDESEKDTDIALPDTLSAGNYSVKLTATNKNHCGLGAEASGTFTVNPLPTITDLTISNANVCENKTTSCELTFTTSVSGNDTIIYSIAKGSTPWGDEIKVLAEDANGKITLDQLDTLSAGSYTVTVTPKTAHGCSKAFATKDFTVHPQPVINLKNNDAFCYGSRDKLTVPYERSENVKEFTYHLKPANGGSDIKSDKITSFGESFDIEEKIVDLPVGDYILYATALSDKNCESENDTVTITVYEMPTAKIDTIYSQCDNAESTTVEYKTTVATNYKYSIDGGETWSDPAVASASGSFTLDIKSLDVGDEAKTYTLKFKAYTATCEVEAEKTFTIYPLPKITVLQDTIGCEGYDVMPVRYALTNASKSKYTYTLTGGGITPVSETNDAEASGYIPVNVAGLADGDYTLTVTVESEYGCKSAKPDSTCTITLKAQPAITKLDPVDSVCVNLDSKILSTTCTYDGDTILYEVLKEEEGGARTTKKPAEKQKATTISFDVKGWEPGKYVLKVTALSTYGDLDCGSTDEERVFLIYPKPGISKLTVTPICEGATTAEFEYAISDAKSMTYSLSGSSISGSEDNPTTGMISFDSHALKPGNYTLTVTATSDHGCDSVKTAELVVNNRPNLKFKPVEAQCYPADTFVITYIPDDVAKIYWTVEGKITTEKTHIVNSEDTLKITTKDWPAGEYTLSARPESALGCDSTAEVVKFTIHPKPTVDDDFTVEKDCQRAKARVDFKHTNGATVRYWIDDTYKDEVAIKDPETAPWFEANIAGLDGGNHTMRLQVVSATDPKCESDETENKPFEIYPLPVITVLQDTIGCEGYDVMPVRYALTNASKSKYTYTLTGGGITPVSETNDAEASGYIPVNVAGLADGDYTLTVTVESEHGCKSAKPDSTCTITLKAQPAITKLDPVDSVCVNLDSKILSTTCTYDGDTIRYEVLKEEEGGARTTKKPAEKQKATTISFDVKGWEPGKYVLKVTALSTYGDLDCGSTDEERVFLIYPKPGISKLTVTTPICEGATTAEFEYAISDAKSMTYSLSGTTISGSEDNPTTGKITFNPSGLKEGTYTLTVTATSEYGCDSVRTATLVINDRPWLSVENIDGECYPIDSFTVEYDHSPVTTKIVYTVDTVGGGGTHTLSDVVTIDATKKFILHTKGWPKGTYELTATPKTDDGCDSTAVVQAFTIHEKPTVSNIQVTEQCETGTTQVTFNHTAGNTYEYWIKGTDKHGTGSISGAASGTFNADIDGLPGSENEYTLRLIAKSATCVSDTIEKGFLIFARSNMHFTSDSADLSDPASYGEHTVKFADNKQATSARWYVVSKDTFDLGTWTSDMVLAHGTIMSGTPVASGEFTISGLENRKPGTYYLYGGMTTANGCNDTITPLPFEIYDPTTIKITELTPAQCAGDAVISVTIETTYAEAYSYVVKNKETKAQVDADAGTTTSGHDPIEEKFNLTKQTGWEAGTEAVTYTLVVTATNAPTHSSAKDSMEFVIYPIPTVKLTERDSICEGTPEHEIDLGGDVNTTKASFSIKLAGEEKLSGDHVTLIDGKLTLSTAGLINNTTEPITYDLTITPHSSTTPECTGEEKSMKLVLKNRPEITLTAPINPCEEDKNYSVEYTDASADAHTYAYYIYDSNNEVVAKKEDGTISAANGTIPVDLHKTGSDEFLPHGTYTIDLTTTTELGCTSEKSSGTFTINEKPKADITSVANMCDNEKTSAVEYTSSDVATKYEYRVFKSGEDVALIEVTGQEIVTPKSFAINISTLEAGNYQLELVTKTEAGCVSDTARETFTIWQLPSASYQINDTCIGQPSVTVSTVDAHWNDEDVRISEFVYDLELDGTGVIRSGVKVPVTSDTKSFEFEIATADLTDGDYKVHIVPVSTHNCYGDTLHPEFTIYPLPKMPSMTFESPKGIANDSVCEGTDTIWMRFPHTGADKYSYALIQGSDTVRRGKDIEITDGETVLGLPLLTSATEGDPQVLEAGKAYDLKITLKNNTTTCELDDSVKSFYIRKNPVVTLTPKEQSLCQPVDTVQFHYKNEGANRFNYWVLRGADTILAPTPKSGLVAESDWKIDFGAPLLKGTYTIEVTPEDDNCEGKMESITFKVDTLLPGVTNAQICHGEKFDWIVKDCKGNDVILMKGLTESTHQMDTLECDIAGKCDTVYELNLTVHREYAKEDAPRTLCAGGSFEWRGGQIISKAGTYEYVVQDSVDVHGDGSFYCDSIYRIVVDQIVPEEKSSAMSVCYGEDVIFNGKTYSNLTVGKQVLLDTIKADQGTGCDSVYLRLDLTVGQRYYDSITVTACDKYVWEAVNGGTYTHSGIYREEYATVDGCDSVFVLNLTINESYEFYETYDIDSTQLPFTVHEYTYEKAGTYEHKFVTVGGCDSVYTITVNVHKTPLPKDTTEVAICADAAPYNWVRLGNNYGSYPSSGWYSKTEPDSIHVLHLTVNKTYSDTVYVHACESYTWAENGTTYTTSTEDKEQLTSSCDCDSTIVLKLTIGNANTGSEDVTACQYETVEVGNRSFIAMADESFTRTLTNASGCDSVVTYNVAVTGRTYKDSAALFCETFEWNVNGHTHTYEVAGTYFDTIFNNDVAATSGCATTISKLELTAKPQYHFDEDVEVSDLALPYVWFGHKGDTLLSTNGDYYDIYPATEVRCDSVYHIHFHVNFYSRDTVDSVGCGSVEWRGETYTEPGLVTDTVASEDGRNDSIYYCNVIIYQPYSEVEPDVTVCSNEPYEWRGQGNLAVGDTTLTENRPLKHNGELVAACDSVFKITVHVVESFYDSVAYEACPNELPYKWRGQLLTTNGDYTDVRPSPTGCDSTFVLHFTVNAQVTPPDTVNDSICRGKTYEWKDDDDNLLMKIEGIVLGTRTYYSWYTVPGECDSTYYMLNLKVQAPVDTIRTIAEICYGDSYDWIIMDCDGETPVTLMKGLRDTTHQIMTRICDGNQCDPAYELYLTVHPEYAEEDAPVMLCIDDTLPWRGGQVITAKGTYEHVVKDAVDVHGDGSFYCDSVYRITVDQLIPEVKPAESQTVCYGTTVTFNDKTYTDLPEGQQTLFDTIRSVGGCDSVYMQLNLTVGKRHYDSITVTACDKYVWEAVNGGTYTHSGIYREEYTTVNGCDSIFVLNLTVNESYEFYETYDIWNTQLPYTVHEFTYTEGGTYDRSFTSKGGCDSIYHITLNVHEAPLPKDTTDVTICADATPYNWVHLGNDYGSYANAGWFSQTETDSIHVLHLTVNETYSDTIYAHGCGSYTWEENDSTYTVSTIDKVQLNSSCNCDSTIVLKLTIGNDNKDTIDVTACQYEPIVVGSHSLIATVDTLFNDTLTNASKCDSVITYNVTVTPREYVTPAITDTFCEGTPYVWDNTAEGGHSHTYESAGTYYDTIADVNGCATKIFTLELSSKPQYRFDEDVEVSELALPYKWLGHKGDTLLSTDGDYYDIYPATELRCDSVYHIHFHVNFYSRDTVDSVGCGSVEWRGETYTEPGLVTDTVASEDGRNDSIYYCNVIIYQPYSEVEPDVTICSNEPFEWRGQGNLAVGDTTLTENRPLKHNGEVVAGCDSVFTITVHVVEPFYDSTAYAACPTELPYEWHGKSLEEAKVYYDSLSTITGCDSIYVLNFSIQEVTPPTIEKDTICQGKSYTWVNGDNLVIAGNEPGDHTYYHWYTVPGECAETYYRLDLTVTDPATAIVTDTAICYGETFDWIVKGCNDEDFILMKGLTETTHEQVMLDCPGYGCNPLYELNLTVYSECVKVDEPVQICAGGSYPWRGNMILTEAGEYEYKEGGVADVNGDGSFYCDSIYRITVTQLVPEQKSSAMTVCYGEDVIFNGKTYSNLSVGQQVLLDTIKADQGTGCDSVYLRLDLTVGQRYYDSITVTACGKYVWEAVNGNTYTHTGIYREEYTTVNGCDSIFVLNLTVNESYEFYETYDIDSTQLPFTVHEYTFKEGGKYDRKFTTIGGCDSIYHITLNVHKTPLPKDTTEVTICADATPYNWVRLGNNYGSYANSGWFSKTEPDSIHVLHLTVNKTYSDTIYAHGCGSYTWEENDSTYTVSTIDKVQLNSSCNCDSTIVLKLTIGNDNKDTIDVPACQYEPIVAGSHSFIATVDTMFNDTIKNVSGCDSVITFNVAVTPREYVTPAISDTFCEGTPYVWDNTDKGGHSYTYESAGTYFDTIADANGCATKIFTLELSAKPKYWIDEDVEVAEQALPYTWFDHKGDTLLSTDGDYYDIYPATELRCDSVYHIHFHVNFYSRDTVDSVGCGSVEWRGETYTEPGLVTDTVASEDGRNDSIYYCNVIIYQPYSEVEPDVTVCSNEPYEWRGQGNLAVGDTTLTENRPLKHNGELVAGCDSVFTITVHVVESFLSEQDTVVCPSELPYLWRGQLLTVDGDYTDVRPSPTGCDSTFVLHFSVDTQITPSTSEQQTYCQDSLNPITWENISIPIITPGEYTYYNWFTVPGECDSTYHRLDLTVIRSERVGGYDTAHICYNGSYEWHEHSYTVEMIDANYHAETRTYEADYDTIRTNIFGCDSLDAHLHLVMHTPYEDIQSDTTICNKYLWIDTLITTTGTYTKAFTTVYGCQDSTLTRHFDVFYSKTDTLDSVFACDSYRWRGQDFTEEGDTLAEFHVQQLDGSCDSIVYLPLTIHKTVRDTTILDWWCTEFTWGETGDTYTESKVYEGNRHPLDTGCDSIPYLRLTLHDSIVEHIYDTACVKYTWEMNGMTYTGSEVVRYVEQAVTTGCDSAIHWLHLTINQPSPVTFDTVEACLSYIHEGTEYTDTTDIIVPLKNIHGCDSIVRLHINVTHPDTIYDTIRTCNSYERNNETFYYSCDTVQRFDCDSVVLLNLTIDLDRDSDIYVTKWDSYEWEGETYTESGDYTKTLQTLVGHCDSTVTLHLIINDSKDTVERQIACETFTWDWNDSTYLLTTVDTVTKRIDVGLDTERDSTRILELGIGHKKYTAFADSACEFYNWHGVTYFESQTIVYPYTDTCENNVDTLHLTIFKKIEIEYYDTACDVMTIHGKSYFSDTTFTKNLQTDHGCDSIVTYHLTIHHRQTRTIPVTACDSLEWEGTTYTKSGVYTKVLTGVNGCDSVVTLKLSIRPSAHTEFDAVGCGGYYVWGNRFFDAPGDYDSIFTFEGRCDSVVTMHLTLPEAIQGPWAMDTACDEFWWNGQRYTETGLYYETFTSAAGCDSIARLDLTIADNPRDTITETAEKKFTWRGQTYYESGYYEQRFHTQTGFGCDSIVTLDLTITDPEYITQIADTACDAYTWDTETFYESGIYTRNFPTADGNDSIVKLSLVINHDVATTDSMQLCDSVEWNGVMYYETGVYTQVLQTQAGCDSVVTMILTVCRRDSVVFSVTARDVYTWDGVDYTESGEYSHNYTSSLGCDSVVTMHLTILNSVYENIDAEACTEYAWADSIYTHSTIHTEVFKGDNGCDSVVTLTLIIHEPVYTDLYDTVKVCDKTDPLYSEYYILPWSDTVRHTGIYTDTLVSELSQCDSIVRFHLQWCDEKLCIDTTRYSETDCESYTWPLTGATYTTTGTYEHRNRTEDGCEHVSLLRLDIKPKTTIVIDTVACDSMFWARTGKWYYESGFAYDTLPAANGCDSVIILHAVIGHSGDSVLDVETCDAYTMNGKTYRETGTYVQHLLTTTGCDSTLTINLTVIPSVDTIVADTACDSRLWNGVTLTETGFYPMVLKSELTGCDSVVDLHLIVYDNKEVSVIDSLHCDSIVWGDAYSGIETIYDDGIYVKTFRSTVGCDSTVTMDLRLKRKIEVTAKDTAACDSFVWNGKVYYESGTYSDTQTSMLTGCDSITTMKITIDPIKRVYIDTTVAPPFFLWPTEKDTIWKSGVYPDTTKSLVTGCDSITTMTLMMTDSIIIDTVRIDTFGYCQGDTAHIIYDLSRGFGKRYTLVFAGSTVMDDTFDPLRDFESVTDTTDLPDGGMSYSFDIAIPRYCRVDSLYTAVLTLYDDYSSSEPYTFVIKVSVKNVMVSMWSDVVAINNYEEKYSGYQWYNCPCDSLTMAPRPFEIVEGATKQYYSNGEDLYGWYRARLKVNDSTWIYTCEQFFDLRSDSLELIAYPTPAPVGQPVTIKAIGIILEKLEGSRITIRKESGLKVEEYILEANQRSVDVNLTSGLYIATLETGDADDRTRTANVKFIVF